ncbi:site-specific tyrosine recombinase XerC [Agaribacter flavus]|uniref:Site-specific tyrosine recombinase XerC n=1 Tax=Agaribacter flavus TaxID=1902781 RepID=A0ABV7FLC2_9ALTE
MAKLKRQRCLKSVGDPTDPQGLFVFMQRFIEVLEIKHYTDSTILNNERAIRDFIAWCDTRMLRRPTEITKAIIERYQRSLYLYRKPDGMPLSVYSLRFKVAPLIQWFKWLSKENYILYNPAADIDLPKQIHTLPKAVLSEKEAEQILQQPNTSKPLGIRDRAILELLYSTGIRRMEVVYLQLYDIDRARRVVQVRQGKGRKDRIIPIGERALYWILRYTNDIRPEYARRADSHHLFLSQYGEPINPAWLSSTVRRYIIKAGIKKSGSCHLFRHTMATLMLENGADVRYIQAMLGHEKLETTQIYTKVAIKTLKKVHAQAHPAQMNEQQGRRLQALLGNDEVDEEDDHADKNELH